MNHISKDEDFSPASSRYDIENPINNLVRMFKKCQLKEEAANEEKKVKETEEREKKKEEAKKTREERKALREEAKRKKQES
jgi:hypothetical protein